MNLNLHHLKELSDAKGLDLYFFVELLRCDESFSNLRYKHNIGQKWGFWEEANEIFEKNRPDARLLISSLGEINPTVVKNLATFLPTIFMESWEELAPTVYQLSYRDCCFLVVSKELRCFLSRLFCESEGGNSTGKKANLLTALYLARLANYEDTSRFKNYLSSQDRLSSFLLEERDASSKGALISQDKSPKVAVFVTGQVRSELDHLAELASHLEGAEIDVYFSSWKEKGGHSIKASQPSRYFEKEAYKWLLDNDKLDLEKCESFLKQRKSYLTDLEVRDCFSFASSVYVNIDYDESPPFQNLTNPEKMYYHNSVWIRKLGINHFKKYDMVIKLRPDVRFTSFNLKKILNDLKNTQVVTEDKQGWIFREWGFGIGDQVLIGSSQAMLNLLGIYNPDKMDETSRLMTKYLGLPSFMGHVNLGIKAVMQGIEIIPNNYFNIQFCQYDRLSLSDVRKLMEDK